MNLAATNCAAVITLLLTITGPTGAVNLPKEYATFEPRFIRPDSKTELYVIDNGRKNVPVVIVLHGGRGAEHSYMMQPLQPLASNHRVVLYDQRGSLRSPTDPETLTVDRQVEDLEYLRKSLGISSFILVAHSMGGFLGASYIVKYPANVSRAVFIGPVPPTLKEDFWSTLDERSKSLGAKEEDLLDELKRNNLTRQQNPNGFTEDQDLLRRKMLFSATGGNVFFWRENYRRVYLAHYAPQTGAKMSESMPKSVDLTGKLRAWGRPLTVIAGSHDYIPLEFQQEWTNAVPNARLIAIKDCAHLPWIDQPRKFRAALLTGIAEQK